MEWLGAVPAHWEAVRLKSLMTNVVEQVSTATQRRCFIALENVESWTGKLDDPPSRLGVSGQHKSFRTGDVLFGKLRPYLAKVTRAKTGGGCVGEFLVLRSRGGERFDEAYAEQLLRSKPVIDAVDSSTYGARMPRAEWSFIGGMRVVRPPPVEQAAIARFLNHATSRIERYIRSKEKLIALLEKWKQVIVHDAVTGRIDVRTGQPYPAYKPSGIEWMGEVPAHWRVRRLKSLVARIDQGVSPQAENRLCDGDAWGVLKAGCVNGGVFKQNEHKRLGADFAFDPTLAIANGDILLSRASGSPNYVGSVGCVSSLKYKLILSDKTFRLVFKHELNADFMVQAMNSRYYREQVGRAISGAEGLASNLSLSSLRAFFLIVPLTHEQNDIVLKLREAISRLNAAAKRTKQEISLLHEYRTRLIADVVTGKLDVRGPAAKLLAIEPNATNVVSSIERDANDAASGGEAKVPPGLAS